MPLNDSTAASEPRGAASASAPAGADALVARARALAAQETGAPATAFELLTVDRVTWRDGSLGCPRDDRLYPQALVPGVRIVLRHAGREYLFHGDRRGTLVRCPAERAQTPAPSDPAV